LTGGKKGEGKAPLFLPWGGEGPTVWGITIENTEKCQMKEEKELIHIISRASMVRGGGASYKLLYTLPKGGKGAFWQGKGL